MLILVVLTSICTFSVCSFSCVDKKILEDMESICNALTFFFCSSLIDYFCVNFLLFFLNFPIMLNVFGNFYLTTRIQIDRVLTNQIALMFYHPSESQADMYRRHMARNTHSKRFYESNYSITFSFNVLALSFKGGHLCHL